MLRTASNTKVKIDFFDTFQYFVQQVFNCGFEGLLKYRFFEKHCCIPVIMKCIIFITCTELGNHMTCQKFAVKSFQEKLYVKFQEGTFCN